MNFEWFNELWVELLKRVGYSEERRPFLFLSRRPPSARSLQVSTFSHGKGKRRTEITMTDESNFCGMTTSYPWLAGISKDNALGWKFALKNSQLPSQTVHFSDNLSARAFSSVIPAAGRCLFTKLEKRDSHNLAKLGQGCTIKLSDGVGRG